jgi:hypothetical protein
MLISFNDGIWRIATFGNQQLLKNPQNAVE